MAHLVVSLGLLITLNWRGPWHRQWFGRSLFAMNLAAGMSQLIQ